MPALAGIAGGRAAARDRHVQEARRETTRKLRAAVAKSDRERQEAYRERMSALDPLDFLERLGYNRDTNPLPFHVIVEGHDEECKCTFYSLSCTLGTKGEADFLTWKCRKRLCNLREDLHDHVKEALGPVYVGCFEETPFAKYGGLPGTTARLKEWFRTLTEMINAGYVAPEIVSFVLCFLCAPQPKRRSGTSTPSNASTPTSAGGYPSATTPVSSPPRRPSSSEVQPMKIPNTGDVAEAYLEEPDKDQLINL